MTTRTDRTDLATIAAGITIARETLARYTDQPFAPELRRAHVALATAAEALDDLRNPTPQAAIAVHIQPDRRMVGKLAEAEVHFLAGPLQGLKLIGFGIWERRSGSGRNVTFPARQYAVNGERRSFALLRPIADVNAQESMRWLILGAYEQHTETPDDREPTRWLFSDERVCLGRADSSNQPLSPPTPPPAAASQTTTAPQDDPPLGLLPDVVTLPGTAPAVQTNTTVRSLLDLDAMPLSTDAPPPKEPIGFVNPGTVQAQAIVQAVYGTAGPMPTRPRRF